MFYICIPGFLYEFHLFCCFISISVIKLKISQTKRLLIASTVSVRPEHDGTRLLGFSAKGIGFHEALHIVYQGCFRDCLYCFYSKTKSYENPEKRKIPECGLKVWSVGRGLDLDAVPEMSYRFSSGNHPTTPTQPAAWLHRSRLSRWVSSVP